ncbi:unnamed protein product [Cladocopium goreaui]|uniref:Uncharacterized protein n=1 Tax=Cladocopium goreaui TaxID=2562237 RepID=A0A9P1FKL8_9DINO|nr:unnamed protein product [Cladocopium goreaui]
MRWTSGCAFWLFALLPGQAEEAIPDKVGVEVHLTKQERTALKKLECSMCKVIISEMHTEVTRHSMTAKGAGSEEQVWETSNAMCLALLQKYGLRLGETPSLEKKAEDDEMALAAAAQAGRQQEFMRAMLVLKMGCQQWLEDYGGDTSGFVYKSVKEGSQSPAGAAQEFCVRSRLCGKAKERKKKQDAKEKERLKKRMKMAEEAEKKEQEKRKEDPMSSLPEDSKFGIQRMLEMARDDPLHYMDEEAQERVHKARGDLRCPVCSKVLEEAFNVLSTRPKSLQSEHDILTVMEKMCTGGPDLSMPSYFGVEPPPLAAEWTDRWRPKLDKKSGRYSLKPFGKGAKGRQKWRKLSEEGKQKPLGMEENEQDMILTMTCKDVLEPERFSESLFQHMASCEVISGCRAASAAANDVCRGAGGEPCGDSKSEL